eukprot:3377367-Amphidinium_carterae.1
MSLPNPPSAKRWISDSCNPVCIWRVGLDTSASSHEFATLELLNSCEKVQTFVQKRDAESGCSLCARWEGVSPAVHMMLSSILIGRITLPLTGLRQLLACEPSPKLSSLLEAVGCPARSGLHTSELVLLNALCQALVKILYHDV